MKQKKQTTSDYILDIVAPIFNKKGYVGTSMSDLTEATNLTKGAIYCNFKNKEDLALQSFYLNVDKVITPLTKELENHANSFDKLLAICTYYRSYYDNTLEMGGCPLLNVGTDAKNINSSLFNAARKVSKKLLMNLVILIQNGINKKEIKNELSAKNIAKNIYSMIEGGIFMSTTHRSPEYLNSILTHIEEMIHEKVKI